MPALLPDDLREALEEGLFRVAYTERRGVAPVVKGFRSAGQEERWIAAQLFYVGATRAMVRLYLTGHEDSRFVRVARAYAEDLAPRAARGAKPGAHR